MIRLKYRNSYDSLKNWYWCTWKWNRMVWESSCTFPVLSHDSGFAFPSLMTQISENCQAGKMRPSIPHHIDLPSWTHSWWAQNMSPNLTSTSGSTQYLVEILIEGLKTVTNCCNPAPILPWDLLTDLITHCAIVPPDLNWSDYGYKFRAMNEVFISCVLEAFSDPDMFPRSLWTPISSSHQYKYLVILVQSFWSLNHKYYRLCFWIHKGQVKTGTVKATLLRLKGPSTLKKTYWPLT